MGHRRWLTGQSTLRASNSPLLHGQSFGGEPNPPPPGVSMRSRSPAASSPSAFDGMGRPLSRSRPGAPASPPSLPTGGGRPRPPLRGGGMGSVGPPAPTEPPPPPPRPAP